MPARTAGTASAQADPGEPDLRRARLFAVLGLGGAALAIVLVGALHLLPGTAQISPVQRTISEYALTDSGWAFNLGVIALAAGSLAVLAALVSAGRAARWSAGTLLGAVWAAALVAIVLFPKHNWSVGPSTNGHIHRVASIVAFLALPLAVLLLTRRRGTARGDHPRSATAAGWLAVLSLVWFSPLVGALMLAPVTGTPWYRAVPLGLVERGLVMSEVTAVLALGIWALTSTRRTAHHRPAATPVLPAPAA
jgi:hypothetical protein